MLFDSSISITGSAELSPNPFTATTGGAIQGGTLTQIIGGVTTTTTVTGTNPLAGTLTDINDGFGIALNASGSSTTATSEIDELFGDYSFVIKNDSLIDTYIVNLKLAYDNRVTASGTDAYGNSEISLDNVTGGSEIFFSGLSSDTIIGNRKFVFPDANTNLASGSFGGSLTDIGSLILSFTLAPGATVNLGDGSFEVNLDGGAFAQGSFSAAVTTLLTVDSVTKQQTTPPNAAGAGNTLYAWYWLGAIPFGQSP